MANTVYNILLDGNDIRDYVTKSAKVPFVEYTRSGEPIISSVKMLISINCPYPININSVISLYQNSNLFFYGLVKNKEFTNDTSLYEVMIESKLTVLQEKKIDKTVMGDISAYLYGPDFKPTMLMKCYFEKCGLTLDTSAIEGLNIQSVYIFTSTRGFKTTGTITTNINNYLKRPETLFAINQSYAADATFIDSDNDAKANKITFWDHFCRMCSNFNVVPIMTGINSYKMVQMGSISVLDDDRYVNSILTDWARNASDGVSVMALWSDITLNWVIPYTDTTKQNPISDWLFTEDGGSGKGTIPWFNNDIWYLTHSIVQNGLGSNLTTYLVQPSVRYPSFTDNYLKEATKNFVVTKTEGPARFDNVAIRSNLIDIKEDTSEIVQETIL